MHGAMPRGSLLTAVPRVCVCVCVCLCVLPSVTAIGGMLKGAHCGVLYSLRMQMQRQRHQLQCTLARCLQAIDAYF